MVAHCCPGQITSKAGSIFTRGVSLDHHPLSGGESVKITTPGSDLSRKRNESIFIYGNRLAVNRPVPVSVSLYKSRGEPRWRDVLLFFFSSPLPIYPPFFFLSFSLRFFTRWIRSLLFGPWLIVLGCWLDDRGTEKFRRERRRRG